MERGGTLHELGDVTQISINHLLKSPAEQEMPSLTAPKAAPSAPASSGRDQHGCATPPSLSWTLAETTQVIQSPETHLNSMPGKSVLRHRLLPTDRARTDLGPSANLPSTETDPPAAEFDMLTFCKTLIT